MILILINKYTTPISLPVERLFSITNIIEQFIKRYKTEDYIISLNTIIYKIRPKLWNILAQKIGIY